MPVGEQAGGATDAEQAVGDEHGALVAKVPVLCDVLSGHNDRQRVRVPLRCTAPVFQTCVVAVLAQGRRQDNQDEPGDCICKSIC